MLKNVHKLQPTGARLDELALKNQLKVSEAQDIAKDIMFSRQRVFEYLDKP